MTDSPIKTINGFYFIKLNSYIGVALLFHLALATCLYIPLYHCYKYYPFPDLSTYLPAMAGFTCVFLLPSVGFYFSKQTVSISLSHDTFTIRKFARMPTSYNYDRILYHYQRNRKEKQNEWLEFNIYLDNGDWFCLSSNDFKQYQMLKTHFRQYGEQRYLPNPGFYEDAMTVSVVHWLSFLCIIGTIAGYAAHEAVKDVQAKLKKITGTVATVEADYSKSSFRGISLRLRKYPAFEFYASESDYAASIKPLSKSIHEQQDISLWIRESEYEKKLIRSKLPTFGDKYSDFKQIDVFRINSSCAKTPIYENFNTRPNLRALYYFVILLFCFPAWVRR